MATLTVWKFPTAEGAQTAVQTLKDLQRQELIQVHDAATVSWAEGRQEAEDPAAAQHHRSRSARRGVLGDAVRADLLRPAAGHGDRRGMGALTGR